MKAWLLPSDTGACGHYRMAFPAELLHYHGEVDIGFQMPGDGPLVAREQHTGRIGHVYAPEGTDVAVIQRPSNAGMAALVEPLQAQGIAVVVEVDDDLARIDPTHAAYAALHPAIADVTGESYQNVAEACRLADLVTVTTPQLAARYGAHGRVAIIPNYVPSYYLDAAARPHDGTIVGWVGALAAHPRDIDVARGGIGRAVDAVPDASFRVIGPPQGVQKAFGLRSEPEATGYKPLPEIADALAQLDIAVAPLADTAFNRAKSWLKPLEAAAAGTAVVMSPTDPYLDLHGRGIGLVAHKPREWESIIKRLSIDAAYRSELAAAGREAAAGMTVEAHRHLWAEAWEQACVNRRKATLAAV